MAILLGRNVSVHVDGQILSARKATLSGAAKTVENNQFMNRRAAVYAVGWDATVNVEFNDTDDAQRFFGRLSYGQPIVVTSSTGWNFPAVVTGFSETSDLDSAVTYTVEAKLGSGFSPALSAGG